MKFKKESRTCLAVIKNRQGKLIMAGDRRASWGFSQAQKMPRPKVLKRNGILLAGTGDGYICTLFVDVFDLPRIEVEDPDIYMHHQVQKAINKFLIQKGFTKGHNQLNLHSEASAEILMGVMGRLYTVTINGPEDKDDPSYVGIDEVALPYATGCGGQLAWGSLLTSKFMFKHLNKQHLKLALEVAAEVSPGCDSNIDIIQED